MSIFALDERTVGIALRVVFTLAVSIIHGAEDIGLLGKTSTLVLNGTSVVQCLDGMVGILEVVTMTTFVTHAPEDDRGVILLNLHVAYVALNDSLAEVGVLCQTSSVVTHTMTLKVGLCTNVDTILVTQVIEIWVARIVAGTYGIDVELLHGENVVQHTLSAHYITTIGVYLMTVGTLNQDGLTVQ